MVKPLRGALIAAVVLTEVHHHCYRVLSVWLRPAAMFLGTNQADTGLQLEGLRAGGYAIEGLL
jgi:hypothetical protein